MSQRLHPYLNSPWIFPARLKIISHLMENEVSSLSCHTSHSSSTVSEISLYYPVSVRGVGASVYSIQPTHNGYVCMFPHSLCISSLQLKTEIWLQTGNIWQFQPLWILFPIVCTLHSPDWECEVSRVTLTGPGQEAPIHPSSQQQVFSLHTCDVGVKPPEGDNETTMSFVLWYQMMCLITKLKCVYFGFSKKRALCMWTAAPVNIPKVPLFNFTVYLKKSMVLQDINIIFM